MGSKLNDHYKPLQLLLRVLSIDYGVSDKREHVKRFGVILSQNLVEYYFRLATLGHQYPFRQEYARHMGVLSMDIFKLEDLHKEYVRHEKDLRQESMWYQSSLRSLCYNISREIISFWISLDSSLMLESDICRSIRQYFTVPQSAEIFRAIREGNIHCFRHLLLIGAASPWDVDDEGWTLLHVS